MAAYLVLETGEVFTGQWQGGQERAGEVVFNTSHSGYEEMATDPSYMKQILVLSAPMQGNYGVDDRVWESRKIWIEGFVCLQIQNSLAHQAWKHRLSQSGIPLISDLDTRKLILRLRSGGTPWGAMLQAENETEALVKGKRLIAESRNLDKDWVWQASRKETEIRKGQNPQGAKVVVLDFGSKENILRELEKRCREIIILSSRATPEEIQKFQPEGLMLTNGPGNPSDVQVAPQTLQHFIGKIPIFGICMGHQILSLALGAKTYKLRFGHRGSNHPIRDDLLGKIYMTSQNHGYAVDRKTLPHFVSVTQTNLNDQTVAGIFSREKKLLGIQYHPEACPGPHEAQELFDFFTKELMRF